MDSKPFYKSMTFYGVACLFVAGGLNALGILESISTIAGVAGIPLTGFGIRRALG